MKLLFTQDALVNAGAERSHLEILSRFSSEIDVGFVYFYPKHDLKQDYQRAGIRLFFLDVPETYHFPLAIYRLVRLIRREKPDLLISSLWRADMITRVASLLTGVPLIGTLVNDSYGPLAWTDKKGLKYKVVYWLDRLTAGIPVHWIANAQALADSHVKTLGIKRERIAVVYRGRPVPMPRFVSPQTGIPTPQFQSSQTGIISTSPPPRSVSPQTGISTPQTGILTTQSVSPQTGMSSTSPPAEIPTRNFISYGRLLERKGFQDAIKAFSQVIQTHPNCSLTIFGEGPYRKDLENLIQNLGLAPCVFLPGKIQNPADLLDQDGKVLPKSENPNPSLFHCFLFPSWYEGFSGALVEAMMAGIPIIASDIPMNCEAVEEGKTALLFPVGDVAALAEKMTWAIEHPDAMAELGWGAHEVAIDKFAIEKIATQYESLVHTLSDTLKRR